MKPQRSGEMNGVSAEREEIQEMLRSCRLTGFAKQQIKQSAELGTLKLIPDKPKIYHIVHVDRLNSIIADNRLCCDAEISNRPPSGTSIGINNIKQRRLTKLVLPDHRDYSDLHVGDCVPFYFCPRSVMLYLIDKRNAIELTYRDGQEPVIHLEADLWQTVDWAEINNQRWAFTLSNAGSGYFEARCDLAQLTDING